MNPQPNPTQIALGTAAIGRPHYINVRQEKQEAIPLETFRRKGHKTLQSAYDQGIRYFDTAPGYGLAEQLLIDWLTEQQPQGAEVATKWGYTYTAGFDPKAEVHEIKEHSLAKLNEQWKQSRQLLPYLTTYQIHSATFESGVLENIEVLERLGELKEEHGLKIGLSTTGAKQAEVMAKALEIEVGGEALFEAFQVTYNILDQSIFEMGQVVREQGKRLIVKEALANGRLFPNPGFPHYRELYAQMEALAGKYGVGVDAIALRFCMDSLAPFCVLSGGAVEKHITANLLANGFQLEAEEVEVLKGFGVEAEGYWAERKKLPWN